MDLKRLVVGLLHENCYILTINDKTIIIDPGAEREKIIDACKDKNVVGILVTHYHFDHVGALKEIEEYYNIKASQDIDGFDIEVIKTPGHTLDSVSYYLKKEKIMFTGDFLFYHTIGRTDLSTGSDLDMKNSLERIKKYPDDIIIYPGHGISSTLKDEKELFSTYF